MAANTNLYLYDETRERMDALAKYFETSLSAVTRLAIKQLYERTFGVQVNSDLHEPAQTSKRTDTEKVV